MLFPGSLCEHSNAVQVTIGQITATEKHDLEMESSQQSNTQLDLHFHRQGWTANLHYQLISTFISHDS